MQIFLESRIRILKKEIPEDFLDFLKNRLRWRNPLAGAKRRFGKAVTKTLPEWISGAWEGEEELHVPKGYLSELLRLAMAHRIAVDVIEVPDPALEAMPPGARFEALEGLTPLQVQAVHTLEGPQRFGLVEASVHAGIRASVVSAHQRAGGRTLIVTPSVAEMYQWQRLFDPVTHGEIGLIGDGRNERDRKVTIAIPQVFFKSVSETEGEWRAHLAILDAADRLPMTALFLTSKLRVHRQYGLISGPRSDGLTQAMLAYLGPVLFSSRLSRGPRVKIVVTQTGWESTGASWSAINKELMSSEDRKRLIGTDVFEQVAKGRRCLVVIQSYQEAWNLESVPAVMLHSETDSGERERVDSGRVLLVFCLARNLPLIRDLPEFLDCFVAAPMSHPAYVGEIVSRMGDGGRIWEYADRPSMLRNSLRRRLVTYRRLGLSIYRREEQPCEANP